MFLQATSFKIENLIILFFPFYLLIALASQTINAGGGQFWSRNTYQSNTNLMAPKTQKQMRAVAESITNAVHAHQFLEELYQWYGRDNRRLQSIISLNLMPVFEKKGIRPQPAPVQILSPQIVQPKLTTATTSSSPKVPTANAGIQPTPVQPSQTPLTPPVTVPQPSISSPTKSSPDPADVPVSPSVQKPDPTNSDTSAKSQSSSSDLPQQQAAILLSNAIKKAASILQAAPKPPYSSTVADAFEQEAYQLQDELIKYMTDHDEDSPIVAEAKQLIRTLLTESRNKDKSTAKTIF